MLFSNFRAFWKKWCIFRKEEPFSCLSQNIFSRSLTYLQIISTTDFIEKNISAEFIEKIWKNFSVLISLQKVQKKKFRAEFNFFLTKKKIDFLPLIIFSKNASFFPEYALEIWEQKVPKFCSKKSVTFYRESSRGRQNFFFTFVVPIPERFAPRSQLRAFCPPLLPGAAFGLASLGKTFAA